MGMGDIAGVQGWCCRFCEDPFDCCHDLRVSVIPKRRGTCATILIQVQSSARPLMQSVHAKFLLIHLAFWPAINRVRQYWRGYVFS
jgi:hypothetical protein